MDNNFGTSKNRKMNQNFGTEGIEKIGLSIGSLVAVETKWKVVLTTSYQQKYDKIIKNKF